MRRHPLLTCCLLVLLLGCGLLPQSALSTGHPLAFKDSLGRELALQEPPKRVVCLLSSITDLLVELERTDILVGLTRQDLLSHSRLRIASVGSFFAPDLNAIAACHPDLILAPVSQQQAISRWLEESHLPTKILYFQETSLEEGFARMELIGRLVGREQAAQEIVRRNQEQIELVRKRIKDLAPDKRKRVARVIAGGGKLYCPGDDSFQNEMIDAAGGITPQWHKKGGFVEMDLAAWQGFNPQMIYGCDRNMETVHNMLRLDGWKDVEGARNHAFTQMPCSIACQITPQVGAAVQWLAASFYPELFADSKQAVSANGIREERPIPLDLDYVQSAKVVSHRVNDADFKSLVVRFTRPQAILSTIDGNLDGLQAVGNTYVPMHASLGHMAFGVAQVTTDVAENLGYTRATYSGLMTGANMDNLSVQVQRFKDIEVVALVTAGARGNAQRMSRDEGHAHTLGTINIILLTNCKLASEGMARAIITATEAKTAALLDLDIRSTAHPWAYRATGTGTDSMIVVQGEGPLVRYTGGHGKIGELIAKAVHAGVTEALIGQNGIVAGRGVLQRLDERRLSLEWLSQLYPSPLPQEELARRLEQALADPVVGGFIETALAFSDDAGKGLIVNQQAFDLMCSAVGMHLSDKNDLIPATVNSPNILPPLMAKAFGLVVAGVSTDHFVTKEQ
nr:adenosylcobinamide amidohydrolase [uncultured Desulfobulbus sp.]